MNLEFSEVSDQMDYFNLKHNILNSGYSDELKSNCYLVNNLKDFIINNTITKVIIVSDKELDTVYKDIQSILKKYNLYITEYNKDLNEYTICKTINYIEIGATEESKATGLVELSNILHIPQDEILVLGDGDNDIEMFRIFKNSICMSYGTEKAKKLARYITKRDNNHSGVSEGLKYYMSGGCK